MRLWIAIIIAPLVGLAQLTVNYALVDLECVTQRRFPVHVVSGVSLAIAIAGILLAWQAWRAAGVEPPDDGATAASNVRFLAAVGMALSALVALTIGAQWIATAFVAPCLE